MIARITALAPLHVSAGPFAVSRLECAYLNHKLYVLREDALLKAVREKGADENFMEWLRQAERGADLTNWLRRQGLLKPDALEAMSRYIVTCRVPPDGDMKPAPRGPDGRPYLPGSAVKGALRVAAAYQLLKEAPEERRRRLLDRFVADELERFRSHPLSRQGWFRERVKETLAARLDHALFQRFRLGEEGGYFGANTDVFRALRVADSAAVDAGAVSICPVRIHSARARTSPKPWRTLAECFWIGTTFQVETRVDSDLLDQFRRFNERTEYGVPFERVAEIVTRPFAAAEAMTRELYEREQRFFQEELELPQALKLRETPTLRLGWGATMLATSVAMLLPEPLRAELRNTLYDDRRDPLAPKSRKLVEMAGNAFSMGWARVELDDSAD